MGIYRVFKFSNTLTNNIFVQYTDHARCYDTIYGREGDDITLVCPVSPPNVSVRTIWSGPPSYQAYFFNDIKHVNAARGERLSVVKNETTGAYNLIIINLQRQDDEGLYSCDVNTQEKRILLAFYGRSLYWILQTSYFLNYHLFHLLKVLLIKILLIFDINT